MALGSWAKTWGGKGAEAALESLVTHQQLRFLRPLAGLELWLVAPAF